MSMLGNFICVVALLVFAHVETGFMASKRVLKEVAIND